MLVALSGFCRSTAVARLAATATVSGLVAVGMLSGAGTASADVAPQTEGGATATIDGLKTFGEAVVHDAGGDQRVSAGLFEMSVDGGGTLQTYCVDLHNPVQRDAHYQETSWSGTSLGTNRDAGKIRWILRNSYPQVNDLAALARRAGTHGLTEQDAAVGTQVAIWRYSDHAKVDAVDPQAEKLADYLERSARDSAEPPASLSLDPSAVSGRPGALVGPVTVHTNASAVTVIPPAGVAAGGARITDKAGKPLTVAKNGSRIYFRIPQDAADGSAQLTVQASTTVPVGRALASDSRSQTQILAGSSESAVSATATAGWAARGAIPAVSARKNCAKGTVDILAVNKGDQPFTFRLMDTEHTVPAGATRTIGVPLQEDQGYDFTITGPDGFSRRFTGVLDCKIQGTIVSKTTTQTMGEPTPITTPTPDDTNLAATGGSALTPLIAGVAIGLVVIGGAVLVILRKREQPNE
ncbi:TQXA domain-containing protein [Streptomyces misionensis]|uniref:TQXA domain-containing protein n=1 Tax=Streptomyces misionensis TaxID=67331 RepID=A0A1H4VXW1_9ACTN|nr:TQXA domain-containing protein [Streptomyces misionensis]